MIRSMTAFASGERSTEWGTLGCELRAVNHRFLELGVRLPDELRALESALRERVGARVSRGKVDLTLRLRSSEGGDTLQINLARIGQLSELALDLQARFSGLRVELTDLLQFPGVLQSKASDPAVLQTEALALLDTVLDDFLATREREGGKLVAAILERVDAIARLAGDARALMPTIRAGQRAKLEARLADLMQPGPNKFETGRVEQELVLWLQKLDVDEELDRLDSHIVEIRRIFTQREPVGRRLDFLLQEFNREANTLGSKSVDTRTTNIAVELKVLIDQIREQVQNIE
ncbi:YicC/YloC family endoribonuclease [Luteimonas panaciterrae]|uniref:YicC/YloC family endoribonuclease n=1 Tax=Luteimonas panaciterrae TaxID=363885 RepID=UPI001CFBB5B8|nr:YicC/YloC family endoribonuclease [Luteimonas panaciterrae]